jgi:hypothetical protein
MNMCIVTKGEVKTCIADFNTQSHITKIKTIMAGNCKYILTPWLMFSVVLCVYVAVHFVCRICHLRSLQLLVPRCSFGYPLYFVRSAVDSSFDFLLNYAIGIKVRILHNCLET